MIKTFLAAGRRLSDRDLGRAPGPAAGGQPLKPLPAGFRRLTAEEDFPAEILADPEKAEAFWAFYYDEGSPPVRPPGFAPIFPWAEGSAAWRPGVGLRLDWPTELADFWLRTAALAWGAAVTGVAELDERLLYTQTPGPAGRPAQPVIRSEGRPPEPDGPASLRLPAAARRVLVLGFVIDPKLVGRTPRLAALTPPAGWPSFAEQTVAVLRLARFIAGRGFMALPAAGGLFMAAPLAVAAGLGETGRPGLVISPEFGPNLRFFTVVTDWPLLADRPVVFGAADYCETCQRCLNECPARAIAAGPRGFAPGRPAAPWPLNRQACLDHWLRRREPCRKCVEVCPYSINGQGSPGGLR